MTEKTLKDLGTEFEETGRIYIEDIELKAEAIKRYKANLERMQNSKNNREMLLLEGKNQEIEEFNNLTKEDLK